jgi:regulator of RNase E activity RraA
MSNPDSQLLHELRLLSSCEVANAIEMLDLRLRNEGFTDGSIRRFTTNNRSVIGYVATAKIRCSSPPAIGPRSYLERTQWWDDLLKVGKPRILVIEDVDPIPGTGALVGEVHAHILKAMGCMAVVTNGAVRDVAEISALDFSLFAGRLSVSHAYTHIVETGAPVEVGGLKVASGDLIHGDCHGLISIPKEGAARIPDVARRMHEQERELIRICDSRDFSVEMLREAIRKLRTPGQ